MWTAPCWPLTQFRNSADLPRNFPQRAHLRSLCAPTIVFVTLRAISQTNSLADFSEALFQLRPPCCIVSPARTHAQVNSKDPSMCDQSRILVDQFDWTTDDTYFDADAGVRLLVRPGCLKEGGAAGPIAVFTDKRHIVESGDSLFLLSTMIDCQPSGTLFQDPQNPLVLDFLFGEEDEDSEETEDSEGTDDTEEGKEDLAILKATHKARQLGVNIRNPVVLIRILCPILLGEL